MRERGRGGRGWTIPSQARGLENERNEIFNESVLRKHDGGDLLTSTKAFQLQRKRNTELTCYYMKENVGMDTGI